MLKKSLIAIAVLAMTIPVFAGEMKVHEWPTTYVPVEVCKIDVVMDIGYFIHIADQDAIKVVQDTSTNDPYHNYKGSKTTDVIANFSAQLLLSAAGTSAAGGSWGATANPSVIPTGTTSVQITVTGTGVAIDKLDGGSKNVKVAEVTVKVLPA